ncbi:uncharacterized protein LOC129581100 [Paramacrobiotus metropolitanus]|uniref:uncharacterized protein LOC129581100 n=1 Tax=Paramacrobiotus metropolitanus TaxID=2943436 RepID=UPI00244562C9|nr:uncharacterized protein LOC129581100 [Paramacrobiotus metropolitanus]
MPRASHLSRLPDRILLAICLAVFPSTLAINCLVCHSINGSNPACESPHMTSNPTLVQNNCRSLIGSADSRFPLMAVACVTSLGEFKNQSGTSYIVSRYCTAIIPPQFQAKNIVCGQLKPYDINLDTVASTVFGCSDLCTDHACNAATIFKLALRMKEKYGYFLEDERDEKPHFPNIFKNAHKFLLRLEQRKSKLAAKGPAGSVARSNDSNVADPHNISTTSNPDPVSQSPNYTATVDIDTAPSNSSAALTNVTVAADAAQRSLESSTATSAVVDGHSYAFVMANETDTGDVRSNIRTTVTAEPVLPSESEPPVMR